MYEDLKKDLPERWGSKIAKATGISKDAVYKVLAGKRKNVAVIIEAKRLAEMTRTIKD